MKRFSVGMGLLLSGCASAPSLGDAELKTFSLATGDDIAAHERAWELERRETFGGASFSDGNGNILVMFAPGEHDAYSRYVSDHPEVAPRQPRGLDFPFLRVSFSTRSSLIPPEGSITTGSLYFCDSGNPNDGFIDRADLLWRGRLVTSRIRQEIEDAIKTDSYPQRYEFIARYANWDWRSGRRPGDAITLLPPTGDLCFALVVSNWPLAPQSKGVPLRIGRETVVQTIGGAPRLLTPN